MLKTNRKFLFFTALITLLVSCGTTLDDKPAKKELKVRIREIDDSLKVEFKRVMENDPSATVSPAMIDRAIEAHYAYYENYPEDAYAAESLDKVHQLYLQKRHFGKSAETGSKLIAKYPKYKDRKNVLMSISSTYDYMLHDPDNARKYYTMLLKENPKLDQDTRESIEFRLEHLDLTLDEMIQLQMNQLEKETLEKE